MLLNLQPSTERAAKVMDLLGITTADGGNAFFTAEGKAKGLRDIAQVLQGAMSGLTEKQKAATLEIMFGTDAIRAAAVLARIGASGFDEMAASMAKVKAEDVAKVRL